MTHNKAVLIGVALLAGGMPVPAAQAQHQPYPATYQGRPSTNPVTMTPPSWSYDPYTSGFSACLQWTPGESSCRERMEPSYGQPNVGPAR